MMLNYFLTTNIEGHQENSNKFSTIKFFKLIYTLLKNYSLLKIDYLNCSISKLFFLFLTLSNGFFHRYNFKCIFMNFKIATFNQNFYCILYKRLNDLLQ